MRLKKESVKKLFTKDVINTFLLYTTRIFTGPVSMILIPIYLTKQMQGYWYSFISISALSVLADLGFSTIAVQFTAHEFSNLHFDEKKQFVGDSEHFDKIASFFRFIMNWCMKIVLFDSPLVFVIGWYVLRSENVNFPWFIPWIIFVFGSGLKFLTNLVLAFFEGCNEISVVQKLRYVNTIFYFVTVCVCLILRLGIYSIAIATTISAATLTIRTWMKYKYAIKQLLFSTIIKYKWNKEVFSLLWRYSISWISGYFIFQLFTPLAFKNFGSVFAGKVGITITLVTAIFSLANVWIYVINPKLNILAAQRKWEEMDKLFFKNLKLSISTFLGISIFFLLVFVNLHGPFFLKIKERFLDVKGIGLLLLAWVLQLCINSIAVYARAHKEEPFMLPSLFVGIYTALGTFLASIFLPEQYLFIGFYTSFLFALPWFYTVYKKRKSILHT